jgi:hypothetical protein
MNWFAKFDKLNLDRKKMAQAYRWNNLIRVGVVFASISAALASQVHGNQSESSASLVRTSFETGYNYQPDPIGSAHIACSPYNWSVIIDWGDGTVPEALSHTVPVNKYGRTAPGTYPLYSTHQYWKHGSYNVSIKFSVDCTGGGNKIVDQSTSQVDVFDHVPLKNFTAESLVVAPGSPIILNFELTSPAPPSGTGVVLKADNPEGIFQPKAFPRFVEIPPNKTSLTLKIPTIRTAPVRTVAMTVVDIKGPHAIFVEIR